MTNRNIKISKKIKSYICFLIVALKNYVKTIYESYIYIYNDKTCISW